MLHRWGLGIAALGLAACGSSGYALRPVPRILAEAVGGPVSRLQETLGEPRKIDATSTRDVYVWFLARASTAAATGFHGCELEVTVDPRSQRVLGYSQSNIGGSSCGEFQRRVRLAAR